MSGKKYKITLTAIPFRMVLTYKNGILTNIEFKSRRFSRWYEQLYKIIPYRESDISKLKEYYHGKVEYHPIEPDTRSTYRKFMDAYCNFYQTRINAPAKITAADGKALKSIIAYLVKAETCEETAFAVWLYILQNWSKLDNFYRKQIKITQINSFLPNILNQIKNEIAAKNRAYHDADDIRKSI